MTLQRYLKHFSSIVRNVGKYKRNNYVLIFKLPLGWQNYLYVYMCVCVCIYIYMYVYMYGGM